MQAYLLLGWRWNSIDSYTLFKNIHYFLGMREAAYIGHAVLSVSTCRSPQEDNKRPALSAMGMVATNWLG